MLSGRGRLASKDDLAVDTAVLLLTIVTLYVLGVDSLKQFALPLIVGIVAGTYSANLINGYVWAAMMSLRTARKKARA